MVDCLRQLPAERLKATRGLGSVCICSCSLRELPFHRIAEWVTERSTQFTSFQQFSSAMLQGLTSPALLVSTVQPWDLMPWALTLTTQWGLILTTQWGHTLTTQWGRCPWDPSLTTTAMVRDQAPAEIMQLHDLRCCTSDLA